MSDDDEHDDEKVGYGKPPKHSRFKKGQSGNPKGRKPKSRNFDTLMTQELDRKVTVKIGGVLMRVTKRYGIVIKVVDGALRGDPRSLQMLINYLRELGVPDPFGMSAAEDADLKRAIKTFLSKRKASEEDEDDEG